MGEFVGSTVDVGNPSHADGVPGSARDRVHDGVGTDGTARDAVRHRVVELSGPATGPSTASR